MQARRSTKPSLSSDENNDKRVYKQSKADYHEGALSRASHMVHDGVAGITRRMTILGHDTAMGLGIAADTDYNALHEMQKMCADTLAGKTKEDKTAEDLLTSLRKAGDVEEDVKLWAKMDVKAMNKAFLEDMKHFEEDHDMVTYKRKGRSYLDLDKALEQGMDVDFDTYLAVREDDRKAKPLEMQKSAFIGTVPSEKSLRGEKMTPKLAPGEFDRRFTITEKSLPSAELPLTSTHREEIEVIPQKSTVTIYENVINEGDISAAGLPKKRFLSKDKVDLQKQDIWDSDPIASSQLMNKIINYDIKAASQRLMEPKLVEMCDVTKHEQINPTFLQPIVSEKHLQDLKFPDGLIRRKPIPNGEDSKNFLYSQEAYDHYINYYNYEQQLLHEQMKEEKTFLKLQLINKKQQIEDALQLAKDHYCSEFGVKQSLREKFRRFKDSLAQPGKISVPKGHSQVVIRTQLESLKTYTPWFIYLITISQAIALAVMCALGGIATISIIPKRLTANRETWEGMVQVEHYEIPNIWIGPSQQKLIQLGAIFAPCMREDKFIKYRNAKYAVSGDKMLGCCEVYGKGAGTATEEECSEIVQKYRQSAYKWNDTTCAARVHREISGGFEKHKFKPCCVGVKGDCMLTSQGHCYFLNGKWNPTDSREHCSQAHCGSDMCDIRPTSSNDPTEELEVTEVYNHKQFWRMPVSLLYHQGIIHFVIVAVVQIFLGADVERLAGWLRVATIYFLSGFGGLLIGSTLRPFEPTTGAGGAAFGLVGVHVVELCQSWKLVEKPLLPLLKLLFISLMFILAGLLPQVNQFTQVSGFFIGILTAIVCLPYVTFNYWHAKAKLVMILVSLGILLIATVITFFMFYTAQPWNIDTLKHFTCLPFIPYACEDNLL